MTKEEIASILQAVVDVFNPDGCACINDLPGDNYTCTSHQILYKFARANYIKKD